MSKRKRAKSRPAAAAPVYKMSTRKMAMIALGVIALLLAAVSINAYEAEQQELHDLTVVGEGKPVIVQIHDPNCPTCRRLKKAVSGTLGSDKSVLYRLANIKTAEGKALQNKYSVPHVTLLFFDAKGSHVHTTTGLQTSMEIDSAIKRYFPRT